MFLVDTNILILALNNHLPEVALLEEISQKGKMYVSVISIAEFLSKASDSEKKGFEKLLTIFNVLDIDEASARQAAFYRAQSLKASRTKLLDALIAAQAKLHNLTLVSNNREDFPMKDITILSTNK